MKLVDEKPVLAVDIGGSKIMAGIVDASGKVLQKDKRLINSAITREFIIETVLNLSSSVLSKYKFSDEIKYAGVSIPGLADPERGVWIYSSFSGLSNFNIAEVLSGHLNMPVFIGNDVNACALGEKAFGSCKDIDDFIWITVSNGIGGGVVVNGELYEGAFRNAGEIGHISVVENGLPCKCGNRGCLEVYAAGPGITRRYMEKSRYGKGGSPDAKEIAVRAKNGDTAAQEIYGETGYYLGKAIASAVNIVNPRKVILGGGVAMDMELFYTRLEDTMSRFVFKGANKDLMVEKTALAYDASLIGAAAIVKKRIGAL